MSTKNAPAFKFICFSLVIIFHYGLKAQFPNPTFFNTATNATATGTLPVGANDLNWTASITGSLGTYIPAKSCGNVFPGNWVTSPFPNTNWISYPHTCTPGSPAEHGCVPGHIDCFYKLTFNLPTGNCGQSIATPSAYCLSFDFFSDNTVYEIFVNGVSNYLATTTNPYYNMGFLSTAGISISLCNNWQPGLNTVLIHIKSGQNPPPTWQGFLAQANQTLNVSVGQPFSATTTQTNVLCNGGNTGSASVSVSGAGPVTYTWLPTGGNNSLANGLTAGNYTVIASNGVCTATQTLSITQPPAFSVSASPSASICSGGTVILSASGATSYNWSTGATTPSITVNTAGNYSVTFSSGACTSTSVIPVSIATPPAINISGNTICGAGTATVIASGANTYTWSTGATSPSVMINSPGTFSVTGVSQSGCTGSQTFAVTTETVPSITINTSPSLICQGQSATLTATGANTYTWNTGSNLGSIMVSPNSTSAFTVSGSNLNCSTTQTIIVNVAVNPSLTITGNTTLCEGSTGTLIAAGADTYTWSNGQTGSAIIITPTVNTSYSLTGLSSATGCSNTANVSVQLSSIPQLSVTGGKFCSAQSATLSASGATSYLWSNGSTVAVINPILNANTIYTVTGFGTSTLCSKSHTVLAEVLPSPVLNVNTSSISICKNANAELEASGATNYTWSTGATTHTIIVQPLVNTVYTVITTSSVTGCSASKTIEVILKQSPDVRILADSMLCEGDKAILKATGGSSYVWSNAANSSSIEITVSEDFPYYSVAGLDPQTGCYGTDTIEIGTSPSCCEFWIPNSFSPNEDRMNDEFGPKTLCKFTEYDLYIFDKWGELIWHTTDVNEKWNGNFKNEFCQPDVYAYLVRGTRLIPNKVFMERTGHVVLIR